MQTYTIEDLNALVREFCTSKGSLELLEQIRELTLLLYVTKGDIPPNGFIELFNNAQSLDMKSIEGYTKNIVPLKECYSNLQDVEKELLNIVIFIFDILNGDSKKGVIAFLKRTFLFSKSTADIQMRYTFNFIEHTLKLETQERKIFLNELLNKDYFFGLTFIEQKNIIENIMAFAGYEVIDEVIILLEESMKINNIAVQMQLYHMLHTLQNSDVVIEKTSSDFYANWAEQEKLPILKLEFLSSKKRIGIVVDALINDEVSQIILSLAKSLEKDITFMREYELFIYSLNITNENSELLVSQFIGAGCKVYACCDTFQRGELFEKVLFLREKILNDGIEYLIATATDTISNFLLSTRSAKKQLFWSYDKKSIDIKNIEMQISHIMQNKSNSQLNIFTIYEQDEFLVGNPEIKEQAQHIKNSFLAQMGESSVILGTIGEVQEIYNDAYMQDIALIMEENHNVIYFICGSGNANNIKQKIAKFGMDTNRFTFMDSFDKHLFGWIIDIYVDYSSTTYKHTIDEIINKQKPVVLYKKEERKKFIERVKKLIEKKNEDFYVDFAKKEYKDWNEKRKQQSSFIDILENC